MIIPEIMVMGKPIGKPVKKQRTYGYWKYLRLLKKNVYGLELRTKTFSMPLSLKVGDVLATDKKIIGVNRGESGREHLVYLKFEGDYAWYPIFVYLPVALKAKDEKDKTSFRLPSELQFKDRLANGFWIGDVLPAERYTVIGLHAKDELQMRGILSFMPLALLPEDAPSDLRKI